MTRILLIRHATNDTVGNVIAGRMKGVVLNLEGEEQAEELAHRLRNIHIDGIYCSPLERTLQTASPLAKQHNIDPLIEEGLLEINFGEWTNLSFTELGKIKQFSLFNSFRSSTRIPGGELMIEAQVRIVRTLQFLCDKHKEQTVAVFSHGDIIKAAIAHYAAIPADMIPRIEIDPVSVSIIEVYEDTAKIKLVNHTGEIK